MNVGLHKAQVSDFISLSDWLVELADAGHNQLADQIRGVAPNEEQYYDTVLAILVTHTPYGDKWIRSNGRTSEKRNV